MNMNPSMAQSLLPDAGEADKPSRSRWCCALSHVGVAVLAAIAGAAIMFFLSASAGGDQPPPWHPPKMECGKCAAPLNGTFTGNGSMKVGPISITWSLKASFDHATRKAAWITTPLNDPMHLQPKVHCLGVPYTIDPNNCSIVSIDNCTQANAKNQLSDISIWDAKDTISKLIVVKEPIIGQRTVSFNMTRISN